MDMTKFEHMDNPGFNALAGELRRWIKALSTPSNVSGVETTSGQERQQSPGQSEGSNRM
jgi:hypothetical protein